LIVLEKIDPDSSEKQEQGHEEKDNISEEKDNDEKELEKLEKGDPEMIKICNVIMTQLEEFKVINHL
jgi:hypothetical protein